MYVYIIHWNSWAYRDGKSIFSIDVGEKERLPDAGWEVPSIFSNQHSIAGDIRWSRYWCGLVRSEKTRGDRRKRVRGQDAGVREVSKCRRIWLWYAWHSPHSIATPRRHIALLSTPAGRGNLFLSPFWHSSIMNVFIHEGRE